jgi:hypothetical protein|tara:strand:+ start:6676 stop:7371 length:696 start_codon:yes stop_codon:yes gene_type:complete
MMLAPAPSALRPIEAADVRDLLGIVQASLTTARAPLISAVEGDNSEPDALVADVAHFLTIIHGELPGLMDLVAKEVPAFRLPLQPAIAAFQDDRQWLTSLCLESGPRRDRRGLTEAETVVRGLREAMLTLARSSREGCAVGAVLAFLCDWPGLRSTLNDAGRLAFAARWPARPGAWPADALTECTASADPLYQDRSGARAIAFGAQQFSLFHAQLFEMIAARAKARHLGAR